MALMKISKQDEIKPGRHQAVIKDVEIKVDIKGKDYARIEFHLADSDRMISGFLFSQFDNSDRLANQIVGHLNILADGEDEGEIDFDNLFNESCSIQIERKEEHLRVVDVDFDEDQKS